MGGGAIKTTIVGFFRIFQTNPIHLPKVTKLAHCCPLPPVGEGLSTNTRCFPWLCPITVKKHKWIISNINFSRTLTVGLSISLKQGGVVVRNCFYNELKINNKMLPGYLNKVQSRDRRDNKNINEGIPKGCIFISSYQLHRWKPRKGLFIISPELF